MLISSVSAGAVGSAVAGGGGGGGGALTPTAVISPAIAAVDSTHERTRDVRKHLKVFILFVPLWERSTNSRFARGI